MKNSPESSSAHLNVDMIFLSSIDSTDEFQKDSPFMNHQPAKLILAVRTDAHGIIVNQPEEPRQRTL